MSGVRNENEGITRKRVTKLRGRFVWSANLPLVIVGPILAFGGYFVGGLPFSITAGLLWALVIGVMGIVYARHTVTLDDTQHRITIHPARQLNPAFDEDSSAGLLAGTKTGVFDARRLEFRSGVVHRNMHDFGFTFDELWTKHGTQLATTLSYNGWPAAKRQQIRQWIEANGGTESSDDADWK